MTINHRVPKTYKLLGYLSKSSFWKTEIYSRGIKINRLFRNPVLIPWEKIECMDLSCLKELPNDSLNKAEKKYFFLVMVSDKELVKKVCMHSNSFKIWYAAQNVIGITGLEKETAQALHPTLTNIAKDKKIKLDSIWLDF